jgi:hypothetical protein
MKLQSTFHPLRPNAIDFHSKELLGLIGYSSGRFTDNQDKY